MSHRTAWRGGPQRRLDMSVSPPSEAVFQHRPLAAAPHGFYSATADPNHWAANAYVLLVDSEEEP